MSDKIYPKGINIKKPENAPAFVLARVGINTSDFVAFLEEHTKANGWCDFSLLQGEKGPYLVLDTYTARPKGDVVKDDEHWQPKDETDLPF